MVEKKDRLELQEFLSRVATKITEDFDVDEMVLFGSYAKGKERAQSDIDVVVISPDMNPKNLIFENVRTIKRKTKLLEPYLQLFAFHPSTYYDENFIDPGFIKEIKRTGKKIYTKEFGLDFSLI